MASPPPLNALIDQEKRKKNSDNIFSHTIKTFDFSDALVGKTFDIDDLDVRRSHFTIGKDIVESEELLGGTLRGRAQGKGGSVQSHTRRPIHTPVLNVQESLATPVSEAVTSRHVAFQEDTSNSVHQGAPRLPKLELRRGLDVGSMPQNEIHLYHRMCVG
jgi:hypothetical protein